MDRSIFSLLAVCLLMSGGIYMLFGVIPYVHGQVISTIASQEIDELRKEQKAIKDQFTDLCPDSNASNKPSGGECKILNRKHIISKDKELLAIDKRRKAKQELIQESRPHVIPSGGIFLAGIIALVMSRNTRPK